MNDLFGNGERAIPGLVYIPGYIDQVAELELIQRIDDSEWMLDLKRRVQHYGYRYDYKARLVNADARLGDLPQWLSLYSRRLCDEGYFKEDPDQAIVNEYKPGQGIASHIDCVPCFGGSIASLSLASPCIMEFTHAKTGEKLLKTLEARSLVVISQAARYDWNHGIRPRKTDCIQGAKVRRGRRISITFRSIILAGQ